MTAVKNVIKEGASSFWTINRCDSGDNRMFAMGLLNKCLSDQSSDLHDQHVDDRGRRVNTGK
jgi:hypothetical protein